MATRGRGRRRLASEAVIGVGAGERLRSRRARERVEARVARDTLDEAAFVEAVARGRDRVCRERRGEESLDAVPGREIAPFQLAAQRVG